jgi:hypothetical protein
MPAAWQSQFRGILGSSPRAGDGAAFSGLMLQLFALRFSQRMSAPNPGSFWYSSSAASQ